MTYQPGEYALFSACGLNCGLCPRFYTEGTSKCPGCAGEGFSDKHPSCGVLSCCRGRNIGYCFLCDEYPCKKYDGVGLFDSFITHKNQLRDMEKAKHRGIKVYKADLDRKVKILEGLLKNHDDGRRKSFYCLALNLLDLRDIKSVIKQLDSMAGPESSPKEKAAIAVHLFETMAAKRNISLRLRKK